MNPHDRYFAAQRGPRDSRNIRALHDFYPDLRSAPRRASSRLRAFALGCAVGAMAAWLAGAHAAPAPLASQLTYQGSEQVCALEAAAAADLAQLRDRGVPQTTLATDYPELARRGLVEEVFRFESLAPAQIRAIVRHRCLHGRIAA